MDISNLISGAGDDGGSKIIVLAVIASVLVCYRLGRLALGHRKHNGRWYNREEASRLAADLKQRQAKGMQVTLADAQFLNNFASGAH